MFQKPWILLAVLAVAVTAEESKEGDSKPAPVEDQKVSETKLELTKGEDVTRPGKDTSDTEAAADSSKPKRGLHSWGYGFDDGGYGSSGSQSSKYNTWLCN